ncbi:hypothetical protein F5887DRAFT_531021 [Amanita rubescens]|nr:hypothetical protein F5887DRAFT_531021 [Amanita rubescens]
MAPSSGEIGVSPDTTTIAAWQSAPTEIIREIFKYFSSSMHVRSNGHSINFPWYLGHICSTWRIIFRSMSTEFWSTLRLVFEDRNSYEKSVNDIISMAKVFLQCNRGQLFSFNIQGPFETGKVLQAFIPESARWLDASISLLKSDVSILSPVKDRLPHLRSLELNTESYWHTNRFWDYGDCFEIAPNLTYVKLNAVWEWHFDWSNVTTLVLTGFLGHPFHKIIPKLHNLEKLVIPSMLEETSEDYDNMTIITFPRLRILRTLEPMILKVLQTPSLGQLYIDDSTSLLELEPVVPPFLDRSKCTLQNLYIGHFDSSGAFLAILQRSPDIKSLTIRVNGSGPPHYQLHYDLLTCRLNMPSLAPRLKALTMVFPGNSTNDMERFTAMVASRTAERLSFVERLQRVTMVLDSFKPMPDAFQKICKEHGVNFSFVYHDCLHINGSDVGWDLEDDDIKWST